MAVWKEYAPRLDKLHLLAQLERHTFALFCVYAGEFVVANEDVLVKGYSTRVKTASGDYMLRENPPCRGAISRPSDLSRASSA